MPTLRDRQILSCLTRVTVRFSEVDFLGIVWHGNYVKYLEDGREEFGRRFGLEYMKIYERGFVAPVVDVHMQYKSPARIDDILTVETAYVPDRGAKVIYDYTVRREDSGQVLLTARSVQLIQTSDGELVLSKPDFLREWEAGNGIG